MEKNRSQDKYGLCAERIANHQANRLQIAVLDDAVDEMFNSSMKLIDELIKINETED